MTNIILRPKGKRKMLKKIQTKTWSINWLDDSNTFDDGVTKPGERLDWKINFELNDNGIPQKVLLSSKRAKMNIPFKVNGHGTPSCRTKTNIVKLNCQGAHTDSDGNVTTGVFDFNFDFKHVFRDYLVFDIEFANGSSRMVHGRGGGGN